MRLTRETLPLPRAIEPDLEIFAIGDIHGRPDLLGALFEAAAATPRDKPRRRVVLTGDLIDRGPDSLGALKLATEAPARAAADEVVGLMGNHEIFMRLALDAAIPQKTALDALDGWVLNGGDETIDEMTDFAAPWGDDAGVLAAARAASPLWLRGWLDGLQSHHRSGGVLFVHAGVNPATPLETALATPWSVPLDIVDDKTHWAWVRRPFLDSKPGKSGFSGYFVVHGHTPLDRGRSRGHADQVKRFRLNIDGGSATTGKAKMAILRGGVAEVVTADAGALG